jgi:pSer/pThr/pTyr-binding forkhead associated (FHA) protein
MTNYYATLEVPIGSDISVIREAYRRLVQENLWNKEVFADLKEAYEVLSTPARRHEYDQATFGQTFTQEAEDAPAAQLPRSQRCPLQAGAQCPVINAAAPLPDTFCPECGFLLASLPPEGFNPVAGETDISQVPHLEETGTDRTHRLRVGVSTVGREAADVLLTDKTVSRRHAQIEIMPDSAVYVEDLGSTNGTRLSDKILTPHDRQQVRNGDLVRFGSVSLVLHLPPQSAFGTLSEETPSAALASEARDQELTAAVPARARLLGERRGTIVRDEPLVPGVTTFGRKPENNIILRDDPYISGMHAQIIAEGDVFRLTDLGSTNGTFLNGQKMPPNEPAVLQPGDKIGLGEITFQFIPNDVPLEEDVNEGEPDLSGESEADARDN